MKYLVILIVVLAVLWLLRPRRRVRDRSTSGHPAPEAMVVCAHCGVHLPAGDALPGRNGVFCGEAHRAAHEAANTP